jgi:hypothetical protein
MTPDTLQSYRQTLDLYLQHRGKALSHTTRRELLAALCSDRGALNFSGRHDLIGPEEKEVCTLLSPLDLQLVVQSLAVENLQARVLSFVVLSEENGGDISLLEPLEEQEAVLAEGKALLWERHEIECQL